MPRSKPAPGASAAETGAPDILVTSAGILETVSTVLDADMALHDRVWAVNYRGTVATCRSFGRLMREAGKGAIVTIGSTNSFSALPLPAYGPSKTAILRLTQILAVELGRHGVRVNGVAPTYVLTPAMQARIDRGERDPAAIRASGALDMLVRPANVADVVAFLCSDARGRDHRGHAARRRRLRRRRHLQELRRRRPLAGLIRRSFAMRLFHPVCLVASLLAAPALADADFDAAVVGTLGGDPAVYARVVEGFQAAVRDRDADAAAALVSYPIGVSIGGKAVTVRTPADFAARICRDRHARHRRGDRERAAVRDDGELSGRDARPRRSLGERRLSGRGLQEVRVKVVTIQSGPDAGCRAGGGAGRRSGRLKSFGDWVVGCDNFRACTAIGLGPDEGISGYVVIRRGGGAEDAPAVSLNLVASDAPKAPAMQVAFGAGKARFPVTGCRSRPRAAFSSRRSVAAMAPDLIAALATSTALKLTEVDGESQGRSAGACR